MQLAYQTIFGLVCVLLLHYAYIMRHRFPKNLDTTYRPPVVHPLPTQTMTPSVAEPENNITTTKVCVLTATTSRVQPDSPPLPLSAYCIPSLLKTIEPGFEYALMVGYDSDDLYFDDPTHREELNKLAQPVPLLWYAYDNPKRKPGPIFNNISAQAVLEGCDYLYRINDDTEMQGKWTSEFIRVLTSFEPANVGVVGPTCDQGNTAILTHDFVHKTHHAIFGFHYPPVLTDWWLDDWITSVYGPSRTLKLKHVSVIHHLQPTRYTVTFSNEEKLKDQVEAGSLLVNNYLSGTGGDGSEVVV